MDLVASCGNLGLLPIVSFGGRGTLTLINWVEWRACCQSMLKNVEHICAGGKLWAHSNNVFNQWHCFLQERHGQFSQLRSNELPLHNIWIVHVYKHFLEVKVLQPTHLFCRVCTACLSSRICLPSLLANLNPCVLSKVIYVFLRVFF